MRTTLALSSLPVEAPASEPASGAASFCTSTIRNVRNRVFRAVHPFARNIMIRSVTAATLGAAIALSIALAQSDPSEDHSSGRPPWQRQDHPGQVSREKIWNSRVFDGRSAEKGDVETEEGRRLEIARRHDRERGLVTRQGGYGSDQSFSSSAPTFAKVSSWTAIQLLRDKRSRWTRCYRSRVCRKP